MHSYIGIHHFTPKTNYQPLDALIPQIEQTMNDQNAAVIIGEENLPAFKEGILECMEVYYRLVGIDEEVIAGKGMVEPKGEAGPFQQRDHSFGIFRSRYDQDPIQIYGLCDQKTGETGSS